MRSVLDVLVPLCLAGAVEAQTVPERLATLGRGDGIAFDELRGVAFDGDRIFVLTRPGPALHVRTGNGWRQWAREGSGPGELRNPFDLAVSNGRVLELRLRAIAYAVQDSVGYIVGAYNYDDAPAEIDRGKFVLALRRDSAGRWLIAADLDNANRP